MTDGNSGWPERGSVVVAARDRCRPFLQSYHCGVVAKCGGRNAEVDL